MAEPLNPKELVTLQELAVSNAYEIAALVAVLERKGVLTKREVLEEKRRMGRCSGCKSRSGNGNPARCYVVPEIPSIRQEGHKKNPGYSDSGFLGHRFAVNLSIQGGPDPDDRQAQTTDGSTGRIE